MLSPPRLSSLAVRLFAGGTLAALAGCCCPPMANTDGGCFSGDCSLASGMDAGVHGGDRHHHHQLRRGTLPPPVPAPAVASPISRYHPLPTHPVFETQSYYPPLVSIPAEPRLLSPEKPAPPHLPLESTGEPTPALLPSPAGK